MSSVVPRRPLAVAAGIALGAFLAVSFLFTSSDRASGATSHPVGWSFGPGLPATYPGSWGTAAAYFPPLDQVVLFGGSPKASGELWNNTTWIYGGGSWSKGPAAPSGLSPRGSAAMAYDPDLGEIVMFGGAGPEWPLPNDTWLYDGTGWSKGPAAPAGLTGRTGASMVYDPVIHKVVLFGGSGLDAYDETWLFDASGWTKGPAAPAGMGPHVFAGMVWDPNVQKVYLAGGNGGTDGWYFDGSGWAPGPSIAAVGPKERFSMAFDPELGGPVIFGGMGPGGATQSFWFLRGGAWVGVGGSPSNPGWPGGRFDGAMLWHPTENALMLIGGMDDYMGGHTPFTDSWFFHEAPPKVVSASIGPNSPDQSQTMKLTVGASTGGYGKLTYTYAWFKNGVQVPGVSGKALKPPAFQHGDQIQAKVLVTDSLGFTAGWVASNTVTIVDRAPTIASASLTPMNSYVTSTLTATGNNYKDPDGDPVTLHYDWQVNGTSVASNDLSTLSPSHFVSGDSVNVTITPVDSVGKAGASVTSGTTVVAWNVQPNDDVTPGGTVGVKGGGYQPSEKIDLKLDSATASKLVTITADSTGGLPFTVVTMPKPLSGGTHMFYGVGQSSGTVGRGPVKVVAAALVTPKSVAAGDPATFDGDGYVPGETVSVSFPGSPPVTVVAASDGSVHAALVAPRYPLPGGTVVGAAPSGSATTDFTVLPELVAPDAAAPGSLVPVTVTGYAANERVDVSFDGGAAVQSFTTDGTGSLDVSVAWSVVFGNNHVLKLTGATSGTAKTATIDSPATMTITPTSGKSGTTITVDSGPGWVPGETVNVLWGVTQVRSVTADSTGAIHTSFQSPSHAPGTVTVKLTESQIGQTPTATFTVT